MTPKRYSDEEAREILKRAVDFQQQDEFEYTRDQLFDIGREMGLSQEAIVKAEQAYVGKRGVETPVVPKTTSFEIPVEEEEIAFRRHRMQEFRQHLNAYGIVMTFLFLINLFTGMDDIWFVYPALGWGIGVAFHFFHFRQTEGDDYEKEFDKWSAKRAKRIRKRQRRLQTGDGGEVEA
jgi:hypothetical protein